LGGKSECASLFSCLSLSRKRGGGEDRKRAKRVLFLLKLS
jgi:hypothetical protein